MRRLRRATVNAGLLLARMALAFMASAPVWAAGGGRLAATQAASSLSGEVSGPLAYGVSLIMIVAGAISWYRSHHDMSHLSSGMTNTLVIAGVACGAASLLGFVPGVAGAVI